MIRPIVKDKFLLGQKSLPVDKNDKNDIAAARDLLDTLAAHSHECVGMAANMIGVLKRIIVFEERGKYVVMINPEIKQKSAGTYTARESCLCHVGEREAVRYETVEVEFLDIRMKRCRKKYDGFTAEIIQHELDHLEGILI
ncbi:MAG: peptide deformylase [Oscillospiraceae bacterium]